MIYEFSSSDIETDYSIHDKEPANRARISAESAYSGRMVSVTHDTEIHAFNSYRFTMHVPAEPKEESDQKILLWAGFRERIFSYPFNDENFMIIVKWEKDEDSKEEGREEDSSWSLSISGISSPTEVKKLDPGDKIEVYITAPEGTDDRSVRCVINENMREALSYDTSGNDNNIQLNRFGFGIDVDNVTHKDHHPEAHFVKFSQFSALMRDDLNIDSVGWDIDYPINSGPHKLEVAHGTHEGDEEETLSIFFTDPDHVAWKSVHHDLVEKPRICDLVDVSHFPREQLADMKDDGDAEFDSTDATDFSHRFSFVGSFSEL